jgi:hypothetical protein
MKKQIVLTMEEAREVAIAIGQFRELLIRSTNLDPQKRNERLAELRELAELMDKKIYLESVERCSVCGTKEEEM